LQVNCWRRGIARRSIASLIAGVMLMPMASVVRAQSDSKGMSPAARLPANYRQLFAEYIRTHNRYVVRDAKITKPYEKWGGLLRGGSYAVVCVAIFRDNPFGIVVRDNWVLTIENGKPHELALGMDTCADLSPFTELKPR
jgi:hypothetical protein